MIASASLRAAESIPGAITFCSWRAGWRALLLRAYDEPAESDEFATIATPDQLIVLVTGGSCRIESFRDRRWHGATYRPGHLGMTAPREAARLRWRGPGRHATLQLHIPAATITEVADELRGRRLGPILLPNPLIEDDPVLAEVMRAAARAARAGAPELYAETAARYLALHLLTRDRSEIGASGRPVARRALDEVDEYMRANLSTPIGLAELAGVAGLGRFQLLRAAKATWGETPLRRLTRLRMEHARRLLRGHRPIIMVALDCGYSNPTHFATAFRRHVGVTPSAYRRGG